MAVLLDFSRNNDFLDEPIRIFLGEDEDRLGYR